MFQLLSILFGAAFTIAAAYSLGRLCLLGLSLPRTIVFATGAAALSLAIFSVVAAGVAKPFSFLVLGLLLIGSAWVVTRPRPALAAPSTAAGSELPNRLILAILGAYAVLYFVHALAPEIQPDATTYHLGLAREFLRTRGFPKRIAFYEVLPQGIEMLFTMAFAYGKHSAAKLLHFAFLVATFPLMLAIGKRLSLSVATSSIAAGFYLLAPVTGVSGTAAYNDAALVFFFLAAFYVLSLWKERDDIRLALLAGVLAGFCYAIKMNGLLAAGLGFLFILSGRKWRAAALFAVGAALMIAPWMVRNYWWTGNPLAPFFNEYFSNPYFLVSTEHRLIRNLRTYDTLTPASAPLELTVRGTLLQGLLGPMFLLAPLGLLALRRRRGWLVAAMALLMAIPWVMNMGTRFLMPSLPWIALLMVMALPPRIALACLVLHAVLSWPQVIPLYSADQAWRLRGVPLAAALRIEPEREYLHRNIRSYRASEMVEANAGGQGRVLDCIGLPTAYYKGRVTGNWQSAEGERLWEALTTAAHHERGVFHELRAQWPEQPLRALRLRWAGGPNEIWNIQEVALLRAGERVPRQTSWLLGAEPNVWEAAFAMDGNMVSRWSTRKPARAGMFLEVELPRAMPLSGVTAVVEHPAEQATIEFLGQGAEGKWRLLADKFASEPALAVNLRSTATRFLLRRGISYILTTDGDFGNPGTGRALSDNPSEWGVVPVGRSEGVTLYRIP